MKVGDAIAHTVDAGGKAFVPYITAGDPDLETTVQLLQGLAAAGATAIELGVPFSDPVGDGLTIQRASERALQQGVTLESVLTTVRSARNSGLHVPVILFSYLNPIARMGFGRFAKQAASAGVDGVLVVDLPPEEARDLSAELRPQEIDTVFLASPTTSDERLQMIDEASSGFVYYVARTGVTGKQSTVSATLHDELTRIRTRITSPLLVGFGISTPEQAAAVAADADGVVVGSALVELIAQSDTADDAIGAVTSHAAAIVRALQSTTAP